MHGAADGSPRRVVPLLCAAEALSMAGFSTYPALLPLLRDLWRLSNSEAGLISGVFFAGYMAAVPLLTSLTDRIDGRRVYVFSSALLATGSFGFALFGRGLASAVLCQAAAGAGLAGTYMPGLKLLADRVEGPRQSRFIAFYTSTFGLGGSFSLWLTGAVASAAGWRWAFAVAGLGPLLAGALVFLGLRARVAMSPTHGSERSAARLLDFSPVLRNREALGYVLGYAAHCYELFGLRAWLVAFFAFNAALQPVGPRRPWTGPALAAVINLLGPPASILGNELAVRIGRRRLVLGAMAVAFAGALAVGLAATAPWEILFAAVALYFIAITVDSASLTAGVIAAARPEERGTTMALHSFLGFGAGFVAPLVFGAVLDAAGGAEVARAWTLGSFSLGMLVGAGALAFRAFSRGGEVKMART